MAEDPEARDTLGTGNFNDRWQAHLLGNLAKYILVDKSRRVGGTRSVARKCHDKGTTRIDRGYQFTGVSVRQKDAEGIISYIKERHDELPPRFKRKLVGDAKTEAQFVHPNGKSALYQAFPAKATRSKGGDVLLDEFAFMPDDRAVYVGSLPSIGLHPEDQIFIVSNRWTKSGMFYDLVRRAEGKYQNYFHYRIPWWICPRLCTDTERANVEAPLLSTRDRVNEFGTQFMIELFDSFPDLETFCTEFELEFLEALSALFSPELMEQLCVADWGDEPSADLPCRVIETAPHELDWMWLNANKKGVLFGGYDVGRQRHESDFIIWDFVGEKKYQRMIIRLFKAPYRTQEKALVAGMKQCDIVRTCIDSTGIGHELAENLVKDYPGRFEGVWFTPQVKDQLATRLYIAATTEKQELFLPRYRPLILHFVSIKKEAGAGGTVRYNVDLNEQQQGAKHHGDMFWASALGLEAANIKVARGGLVILPSSVRPQ